MTKISGADFAAMAFDARLLYKLANGTWAPFYASIGDDLALLSDFEVPSETTITSPRPRLRPLTSRRRGALPHRAAASKACTTAQSTVFGRLSY